MADAPTPPRATYLQVRDELTARLAHLPYGTALPTERDLAVELGVARMTLRKAVDHLVTEGRLVRRQGAGTFVAPSSPSSSTRPARGTSTSTRVRPRSSSSARRA